MASAESTSWRTPRMGVQKSGIVVRRGGAALSKSLIVRPVQPPHALLDPAPRVSGDSRDLIGAAENDEMLVPVELPDHLMVADDLRVEIGNAAPVRARGLTTGGGIKVPVNRYPKAQSIVTEEIIPASQNSLSGSCQTLQFLGPACTPELSA